MKKIVLGMVAAAAVAVPSAASAQYGYSNPYYGGAQYSHPADLNGDGVVTNREARRYQRLVQRQYQSQGYYGSNHGSYGGYAPSYSGGYAPRYGSGYGSSYGGYAPRYGSGYGSSYGNSYGSSYGSSHGGSYGQYYDRSGYYSGPTWRGDDGRYYCRRPDGTTGTIVGGAAGALIGSQVAGRGDRTLGAIVGGAIGAVIGNSIEKGRSRYRCN